MQRRLLHALNRVALRCGYEIRAPEPIDAASTMAGALHRIAARKTKINGVIDVGAAAGKWTRQALRVYPEASYLLLEPLEERRSTLAFLPLENPRITVSIAAAGDREGSAALNVDEKLDGSGIYGAGHGGPARAVPMTTIDAEVARAQLPSPYLLKLDTHGFELPIFAGAPNTLASTEVIVVEAYNFQPSPTTIRFHEMCAYLEQKGFRCADLADPMRRPGDGLLWQLDLVFLRADSAFFARTSYAPV